MCQDEFQTRFTRTFRRSEQLQHWPGEIWIYIIQLFYERERIITESSNFSIRLVCKSWLKYFSDILFVGVKLTYQLKDYRYLVYEGEWKNFKREGRGKLSYRDGIKIYEGEFKCNSMEGIGTSYYDTGERKYEGEWKGSKKEGWGTFYYNNIGNGGSMFKRFRDEYYYPNGEPMYEGEWKSDVKEGKGIFYYYSDGSKYEGEWKNNMRNGRGTYYYDDGSRYEGDWKDNTPERKGIYFEDGSMYEGEWKDGTMRKKKRDRYLTNSEY